MNRTLLILVLAAALAAGAWFLLHPRAPARVAWQGYAEADFVKVGPPLPGLVTALHVARGDRVEKGQILFEQDASDDRGAAAQAKAILQQARAQLANLDNPSKPTEIAQAQANLRDAEATRDKDQSDLARNAILVKTGAATRQTVEDEQDDLRSANAKIANMQALLDQSQASLGRKGEIAAQAAAVDAAAAAVAQAEWRLAQRSVAAPATGVVADVLARPGETLAAGWPVVSLLPPENIFVRFFVPEREFATLHVGDPVLLVCDHCKPGMMARVSFLSPQAEYTPPFIYSESTTSKFVFLAQAQPSPSEAERLNPGEPINVEPQVGK